MRSEMDISVLIDYRLLTIHLWLKENRMLLVQLSFLMDPRYFSFYWCTFV